ncbi:hypothetical protein AB5I41_23645 [Sphingomonas sp. MMS24-JH45]
MGQVLRIPAGVTRDTYNASTLEAFDPADALGDLNPIDPTPTAKMARRNKCGVFGQVLLVAVAVAVTVATKGALAKFAGSALGLGVGTTGAAVAGGALAGAAGSLASQGVGLATGIQDRFSFKGVALAAIGGAVGGGLGAKLLSSGGVLGGIGRGVLGRRGDAGPGGGDGVAEPARLGGRGDGGGDRRRIVAGRGHPGADGVRSGLRLGAAVGGLAGAAARSLATGTSFGDNLVAALPDIMGYRWERGGRMDGAGADVTRRTLAGRAGAGQQERALSPAEANRMKADGAGRYDVGEGLVAAGQDRATMTTTPRTDAPMPGAAATALEEDIVVVASRHAQHDVWQFTDARIAAEHAYAVSRGYDSAQENAYLHNLAHTVGIRRMALGGMSLALDAVPVAGTVKAIGQMVTGQDWITGESSGFLGDAVGVATRAVPGLALGMRGLGKVMGRGVASRRVVAGKLLSQGFNPAQAGISVGSLICRHGASLHPRRSRATLRYKREPPECAEAEWHIAGVNLMSYITRLIAISSMQTFQGQSAGLGEVAPLVWKNTALLGAYGMVAQPLLKSQWEAPS